jgi:hypothetical protein
MSRIRLSGVVTSDRGRLLSAGPRLRSTVLVDPLVGAQRRTAHSARIARRAACAAAPSRSAPVTTHRLPHCSATLSHPHPALSELRVSSTNTLL